MTGVTSSRMSVRRPAMRTVIFIAVFLIAATAALLWPDSPPDTHSRSTTRTTTSALPKTDDQLFLDAVKAAGLTSSQGDDGLITKGHAVCVQLSLGASRESVRDDLVLHEQIGGDSAEAFIRAAVGAYCPMAG